MTLDELKTLCEKAIRRARYTAEKTGDEREDSFAEGIEVVLKALNGNTEDLQYYASIEEEYV